MVQLKVQKSVKSLKKDCMRTFEGSQDEEIGDGSTILIEFTRDGLCR